MTEREWTKFKDGVPDPATVFIYMTDYKEVWRFSTFKGQWSQWVEECPNYAWSPIELPEVPKEEAHCCGQYFSSHLWECEETEGKLVFNLRGTLSQKDFSIPVKYCPFCGYEAKK